MEGKISGEQSGKESAFRAFGGGLLCVRSVYGVCYFIPRKSQSCSRLFQTYGRGSNQ